MNIRKMHLLKIIAENSNVNQRILAQKCKFSLGTINKLIKECIQDGYITSDFRLKETANKEFEKKSPHNAIILAAGYGMRMVPVNMEIPKGLIEINHEALIERLIFQFHEVDIQDITIVVGFMKEKYEYLIDKHGVDLVVNTEYSKKNNLHSLSLVSQKISNTYIVPCDVWCADNPFSKHELYSWYMVNDLIDDASLVRLNRKMELIKTEDMHGGNGMIGISYLTEDIAEIVCKRLDKYSVNPQYYDSFWEEALFTKKKMIVYANIVSFTDVQEINTYEQLREFDCDSNQLNNETINIISMALKVDSDKITNIKVLKKGMTNRSFLFSCQGNNYIMRIPGEGTQELINRQQEADVYSCIRGKNICDNIIYLNPENGYKITEYYENARVCNPEKPEDVQKCMEKLQEFHSNSYHVNHFFDLFQQINYYEALWTGSSVYQDYQDTKDHVFSLKQYVDTYADQYVLTHIDAVPDNFLFIKNNDKEEVKIIDWEYAAMQDPHVDIAMFAIYSFYNRQQIDELITYYFRDGCDRYTKIKIYCYVSICGLLWSNWCEYKRFLGVEFGEYSLRQYRYAKEFYAIAIDEMQNFS